MAAIAVGRRLKERTARSAGICLSATPLPTDRTRHYRTAFHTARVVPYWSRGPRDRRKPGAPVVVVLDMTVAALVRGRDVVGPRELGTTPVHRVGSCRRVRVALSYRPGFHCSSAPHTGARSYPIASSAAHPWISSSGERRTARLGSVLRGVAADTPHLGAVMRLGRNSATPCGLVLPR